MSPAADLSWRHPTGETGVYLGVDALERARPWIADWVRERSVFLVTTPRVGELFLGDWHSVLAASRETVVLEVPEGEAAKSPELAVDLWSALLAGGGRRDSRIVALGGGSVGDLAGFVAATFLRGIEWLAAPTTLLAQVDASIGGKTAIDLPAAKNSVGSFYHPAAVVADVSWLDSLPTEERRSGLVEVLKIAAADDLELFAVLEQSLEELVRGDSPGPLAEIVRLAVAAKIAVVEGDPGESDRRRILNLGHTLGHAIEAAAGYSGLRHGEAVAYGLVFVARLAAARGGDRRWLSRLVALVERLSLPPLPDLEVEDLVGALSRDKKATREGVFWVLPLAPGRVGITNEIAIEEVRAEIVSFLGSPLSLD